MDPMACEDNAVVMSGSLQGMASVDLQYHMESQAQFLQPDI